MHVAYVVLTLYIYITSHSSHPIFDSPGRTPCTLPITCHIHIYSLLVALLVALLALLPDVSRLPTPPLCAGARPSRHRLPRSSRVRTVFSSEPRPDPPFPHPFTSSPQEPVLAYRAPSYNYHHYADLDRSARCGLFEDQGNAYATSSSEASPCLATPQTLHPTQAFGTPSSSFFSPLRSSQPIFLAHHPHTYSPLEQMQFVESLNNAFSVAAMKQDIPPYETTYPSSFDLHPVYPNSSAMYYPEPAQYTVRPCSPSLTSACAPYPPGYLQQPHYVHQPLEMQSNVQHLLPGPSYSVQPTVMNGHPSIIAPRPSLAGWPRSPAIAQRLEHAADTVDHSHQFLLVGNPDKVQDADSGDLDGSKKNRKKPPALSCYFCRHRKIRCCEISQPGEEKRCK